ncbi:MAG TPA: hypothetical protein V6D11_09560 [Waterburya sp.]|jgi:hypothetical protein
MVVSQLTDNKIVNQNKVWLKLQYRTLKSGTQDKFDAWIMTVEEHWTEEIAACLQGKFPDWRG